MAGVTESTPTPQDPASRADAPPLGAPLLRVMRAGVEESVHRGHVVVVEGERTLVAAGDCDRITFVRSTVKPLQALTGITSGAVDAFDLPLEAVAIAAASHSARPEHLAAVTALLAAAKIDVGLLGCGGHWSLDYRYGREQVAPEGGPPPLWCNCSGKHAMMLAAAKAMGEPLEGYLDPAHAVQQSVLDDVAHLTGIARETIHIAIDGCGAPAPGIPLRAMAKAFIALLDEAEAGSGRLSRAAGLVVKAMRTHPSLVAGVGRFDTDLMEAAEGRVIAKGGAEALHGVIVPERRLAMVVKVSDGFDRGYRGLVIEILRKLDVLDDARADRLRTRHAPQIVRNHAGVPVGALEVVLPSGF